MTAYISNTTIDQIADRIRAASRIALITHNKPDGDAIGSVLAMARGIEQFDPSKCAVVYLMGVIEPQLLAVAGRSAFRRVENETPDDEFELIVVLDTGAWSQLEPLHEWLRRHYEKIIVIDHHSRGDNVGASQFIDPKAAATTQVLTPVLDALGVQLSQGVGGIAEALFLGLATDTGWFRYQNAGPETYALAARLLAAGVDKSRLFRLIEENHEPARLAIEARALASVEYACEGRIAIQSLTVRDFEETGCTEEHLTGVVNLPMIVGRVQVAILLAESERGVTKMSFRGKAPLADAGEDPVDVNALAQQFGGGGHILAAGARMKAGLAEAHRALLDVLATDLVFAGGCR